MKLYAWYPQSYGPLSFFTMAETEEEAETAVRKYRKDMIQEGGMSKYFMVGWPSQYRLVTFEQGEVAINNND